MSNCLSFASFMVFACLAFTASGDWPQFLGPTQNAVATQQNILDKLPADAPKPLWKTSVGPGYGGAAIVGDEVFLLDRISREADVLRVYDLKTGKEKWSVKHPAPGHVNYPGGRCTPAVTDTHVFATGCLGDIYAFDRKTQKLAWHFNMLKKYEDHTQRFGYGQNPLLHKNLVIVVATSSQSPGLIALEQATGKTVWQSENFGTGSFYCSPVLRTIAGTTGILVRDATNIRFIHPDSGKTIWTHKVYDSGRNPITIPTVLPDGEHVFVTNGYGMGSHMLRVTQADEKWNIEKVWSHPRGSQIHPAVFFKDHLFVNFNENNTLKRAHLREQAGLAAVDVKTGKVTWNTGKKIPLNRGPVMLVDEKLLFFDADTGRLHMADADGSAFKPLGDFEALPPKRQRGNNAWAPLAISKGILVVRDHAEMRAYDLSRK